MSKHHAFPVMFMAALLALGGIAVACEQGVEHIVETIQYKKRVEKIISVDDPCNPKTEVGVLGPVEPYQFPQEPPEDAPKGPPHLDGPCSVFHPQEDFDDLVNRNLGFSGIEPPIKS